MVLSSIRQKKNGKSSNVYLEMLGLLGDWDKVFFFASPMTIKTVRNLKNIIKENILRKKFRYVLAN